MTELTFKIELVPMAVSDVDRAVAFYGSTLGWPVDFDQVVSGGLRFVQVTPPGSACSICFGHGAAMEAMMPTGSSQMIQVVVPDADAARQHLVDRDVACSEVDEQPWGRFVSFEDPDGNRWVLQQLPQRS